MQGMPLLVGLDFYQALQVLQSQGIYLPQTVIAFRPSQITVGWVSDTGFHPGFVGGQFPAQNAPISPGSAISLAVQRFRVASVIDMPPDWKQNVAFVQGSQVINFLETLSGNAITTLSGSDITTLGQQ